MGEKTSEIPFWKKDCVPHRADFMAMAAGSILYKPRSCVSFFTSYFLWLAYSSLAGFRASRCMSWVFAGVVCVWEDAFSKCKSEISLKLLKKLEFLIIR